MNQAIESKPSMPAALITSVILHVLLACFLALKTLRSSSVLQPEPDVVLISPDMIQSRALQYVRSSSASKEQEPLKATNFISDRSTVASAEVLTESEATKDMPSQEGVDHGFLELEDRDYSESNQEREQFLQESLPQENQLKLPAQQDAATLEDMVKAGTQKAIQVKPAEEVPKQERPKEKVEEFVKKSSAQSFQPFIRKNRVHGTLSNRGANQVNARRTVLGEYTQKVTSAIERNWHRHRSRHSVDKSGRTKDMRVLSEDANAIMTEFTIRSILTAKLPPMAPEVVEELNNEPLEMTYDVLVY